MYRIFHDLFRFVDPWNIFMLGGIGSAELNYGVLYAVKYFVFISTLDIRSNFGRISICLKCASPIESRLWAWLITLGLHR